MTTYRPYDPGGFERPRISEQWANMGLPMLGQPRGSSEGLRGGSAAEQQHIQQVTRPHKTEHVGSTTGGEQLQMFMTPREIHAKYQGLDADLMDYSEQGEERFGTASASRANSSGGFDSGYHYQGWGVAPTNTRTYYQSRTGGKYRQEPETHAQMWDRKLEESQEMGKHGQHEGHGRYDRDPYASAHTGGGSGGSSGGGSDWEPPEHEYESLYDSVARKGVMAPVHLGTFGGVGSQGLREIVGGHHRIAAATDVAPDQPIPVMHHEDIWGARATGKYS
jgi:hypothetical protein